MFKRFLLMALPLVLIFTACSSHEENVPRNVKSFADEDRLVIFALYAKTQGDANSTINLFEILYERSGKKEYRNEEIIMMIQAHKNERALKRIAYYKEELEENEIDVELERFKIAALLELKSYSRAKVLALTLVEYTKAEQEYQQVAAIYMIEGNHEFALRYLQSAYAINYNEKILNKMAIVLYVNLHKKAEAISNLETHILLHGCSETICLRLASFYSEENNVNGMLRIYLKLYENNNNEKYAQSIIKLYSYKKETLALIGFLEKSGADDALLLQMYINTKNYDKVVSLGDKLYEEEGDPYFLGQSAIFEYEGAENKNDPLMVKSVMEKLETVVHETDESMYLNYLGYLLIDHEIDVKGGMKYVKRALLSEEESPYYLDSLAWGYYKQGKCSKALKLMKKVQEGLDVEDAEVSLHIKEIKKCIKKGKR
ncbi:MAG: hypothetical protein COA44_04375 [Arcobacter sp.]|nr:MAG: hypothetical protein COA44_04375 [Arcobacter sp.]